MSEQTTNNSTVALIEDDMVRHLSQTGRYRILKKLEPRTVATVFRPEYPLRGIILDTETTGLSARKDEIIEIGVIAFTFDDAGRIGDITGLYGGLRQPSVSIPPEITKLTGITDEMVAGQSIDLAALQALIEPADLVIAHNASFDRPFYEAFSPLFDRKAWACSNSEIDWSAHGYEGTKLGYLIGQAGYFHEGHRAVDDCFALLEVLDRKVDGSGSSALSELYQASQRSLVRIFAENSPFDMKDHLKARGYRWSDGSEGRPKSWWIEVGEEALEDEIHYLRTEIYRYAEADPPITRQSLCLIAGRRRAYIPIIETTLELKQVAGVTETSRKGIIMNVTRSFNNWRKYRQTVTELGRMSSRELQDLGITRADIHSVARQSVAR